MTTADGIDANRYPAFTDKYDILETLYFVQDADKTGAVQELIFRLGNTNLSGISNAAATVRAFELARIQS